MAVIKISYSLRIEPFVYAKLKKIAKKESRSISNLINYIIMKEIDIYEREMGKIELSEEEIYSE